jgi:hypothetical protein
MCLNVLAVVLCGFESILALAEGTTDRSASILRMSSDTRRLVCAEPGSNSPVVANALASIGTGQGSGVVKTRAAREQCHVGRQRSCALTL